MSNLTQQLLPKRVSGRIALQRLIWYIDQFYGNAVIFQMQAEIEGIKDITW